MNAPFTVIPSAGSADRADGDLPAGHDSRLGEPVRLLGPEYGAVQRIVSGAAVNQTKISINGDYHQFVFSGTARDVIDSASFTPGEGDLTEFPAEPALDQFDYTIVPGTPGPGLAGNTPDQYLHDHVRRDHDRQRDRDAGARVRVGRTAVHFAGNADGHGGRSALRDERRGHARALPGRPPERRRLG